MDPQTADTQGVLAAEQTRAAALVDRDEETFASCLHDDVTYVHATGVRHDRKQLLRFVAEGPRFLSIELREPSIRRFDDVAIVVGELRMLLQRPGDELPTEARSWVSEVWRHAGDRWRLLHFQSTRIAA